MMTSEEAIAKIMGTERAVDSIIEQGTVPGMPEELIGYHDDLYAYQFHPDGYIAMSFYMDQSAYGGTPAEPSPEYETRATQLFLRNFNFTEDHPHTVACNASMQNLISYEVEETINGYPSGRSMSISFAGDGQLILFATYCNPIAEDDLKQKGNITEEQALDIAYRILIEEYGSVLETTNLDELHWTIEKTTYNGQSVWEATIDQLSRTDFPEEIRGNWSVVYMISRSDGAVIEMIQSS